MRRFAQLSSVLIVALIMSGCGDVYRPVVIPNPPPTPDPEASHNAFVISDNGPANKGTTMQVNVSGDTNMGAVPLGIAPVHASLTGTGGRGRSVESQKWRMSCCRLGFTRLLLPLRKRPLFTWVGMARLLSLGS